MKKIITLFICSLFTLGLFAQLNRTVVPGAGPAPKINFGKTEKFTLDNGLRVLVVTNNKVPAVSYSLLLDLDPIVEGNAAGYTQLAGMLMSSGTTSKTKAELDEAVDFIGATLSASAGGIYGSSLKKHSDRLLEIMTDVLMNPVFPQEELDKNLTQMKSALQMGKNEPSAIANNVLGMMLYGLDDPYGEIMTEETLDRITVDKLKAYHDTYFRPNVAYLVIIGDIKLKDAKKQAEKYFGKWVRKDVPKHTYSYPKEYSAPRVAVANKDGASQSAIYVAHTVPVTPGHPDAIKASVMNNLLGSGSFNAKLFRNLREDKAYTYGAYSEFNTDKRVGSFRASASVRTSVTDSALHEILHEINVMRNEQVSAGDIELTKNMMAGSFSRALESPQTIAQYALNIEIYKLPADYYTTYLEKLAAVTPQDVQETARKYLHPDKAVILAVGNVSEMAESMKKFSPSAKVEEYDFYCKEVVRSNIPEGVTPESVLKAYINAIGGEQALRNVKELKMTNVMAMYGMEFEMVSLQKAPDKVKLEMKSMGSVMSTQIFDGTRGKVSSPQGEQIVEGEMAAEMKEQAVMFPELEMLNDTKNIELVAIENVDGNLAYKMNISKGDGSPATSVYFDVENGLKLKEVSPTPQGAATTVYADYQDFDGVKLPVSTKQTVGPQAIDITVKSVEINKGIDDSEFAF
ncbi:MAG: insulinase family protein [Cytophagaceae bacterium]|jgi:predicted Zn-dependent peptidase/outer membrane lipoprotein-sorting protein|nr:insulinase family protein [Cytophagaceae bacterium]